MVPLEHGRGALAKVLAEQAHRQGAIAVTALGFQYSGQGLWHGLVSGWPFCPARVGLIPKLGSEAEDLRPGESPSMCFYDFNVGPCTATGLWASGWSFRAWMSRALVITLPNGSRDKAIDLTASVRQVNRSFPNQPS